MHTFSYRYAISIICVHYIIVIMATAGTYDMWLNPRKTVSVIDLGDFVATHFLQKVIFMEAEQAINIVKVFVPCKNTNLNV